MWLYVHSGTYDKRKGVFIKPVYFSAPGFPFGTASRTVSHRAAPGSAESFLRISESVEPTTPRAPYASTECPSCRGTNDVRENCKRKKQLAKTVLIEHLKAIMGNWGEKASTEVLILNANTTSTTSKNDLINESF